MGRRTGAARWARIHHVRPLGRSSEVFYGFAESVSYLTVKFFRAYWQQMLAPPAYQNTQRTPALKPGELRQAVCLHVIVRFRDVVKLRVPTRESSKVSPGYSTAFPALPDLSNRTGITMALGIWTFNEDETDHLAGWTYNSRPIHF
jgi:hypothetical protein